MLSLWKEESGGDRMKTLGKTAVFAADLALALLLGFGEAVYDDNPLQKADKGDVKPSYSFDFCFRG
jgi:hypothetical protein